jgi:hypothetical protein
LLHIGYIFATLSYMARQCVLPPLPCSPYPPLMSLTCGTLQREEEPVRLLQQSGSPDSVRQCFFHFVATELAGRPSELYPWAMRGGKRRWPAPMSPTNPIYLPEGNKVPKLPLFEIRAAIVDRTITTFFFPPLSLRAPEKSPSPGRSSPKGWEVGGGGRRW